MIVVCGQLWSVVCRLLFSVVLVCQSLNDIVIFDVDDTIRVGIIQRFVQLEHGTEIKTDKESSTLRSKQLSRISYDGTCDTRASRRQQLRVRLQRRRRKV